MPWFASLCRWASNLVVCCEHKKIHCVVAYEEKNIWCAWRMKMCEKNTVNKREKEKLHKESHI
jgi:hypothetical protein